MQLFQRKSVEIKKRVCVFYINFYTQFIKKKATFWLTVIPHAHCIDKSLVSVVCLDIKVFLVLIFSPLFSSFHLLPKLALTLKMIMVMMLPASWDRNLISFWCHLFQLPRSSIFNQLLPILRKIFSSNKTFFQASFFLFFPPWLMVNFFCFSSDFCLSSHLHLATFSHHSHSTFFSSSLYSFCIQTHDHSP